MINQHLEGDDDQMPCTLPARVSIGMPVFNGEAFLSQSIQSLLEQTYVDFELIISDNASTDRTESICRKYALQDSRIRYVRNSENVGLESNFQRVFDLSQGELFMWASHDDLWEPEFIEELVDLLKRSPDAALAFCRFDSIDADAHSVKQYDLKDLTDPCRYRALGKLLMQDESEGKPNLIMGLMRRQLLQEAQGFHLWSGRSWSADVLVVFRVLSLGRLQLSDRFLFHKRLQVDNRGDVGKPISTLRERIASHSDQFEEWKIYWSTYHRMIGALTGLAGRTQWRLHMTVFWRESMQRVKRFRAILREYRRALRDFCFRRKRQRPGAENTMVKQRAA